MQSWDPVQMSVHLATILVPKSFQSSRLSEKGTETKTQAG